MSKISNKAGEIITGISTAIVLFMGHSMPVYGEGENPITEGANMVHGEGMPAELTSANGALTNITNTLLKGIGLIAVVMLVFGGFKYIISGGDSSKVTAAKNTIIYAIIGLIIVILAYAIVNFVVGTVSGI
jgi:hypothetical protein